MFKYQVHFRTDEGWHQYTIVYAALPTAERVAKGLGQYADVQTVLVSRIWIPRTER